MRIKNNIYIFQTLEINLENVFKLARDTLEPIASKAREREIVEEILERDKNITAERFHRAAKQRVYRVIDRWMHGHPSPRRGKIYLRKRKSIGRERSKGGKKVEARVLKVNVLADKLKQKSRNAPDAVSFFRGGYC